IKDLIRLASVAETGGRWPSRRSGILPSFTGRAGASFFGSPASAGGPASPRLKISAIREINGAILNLPDTSTHTGAVGNRGRTTRRAGARSCQASLPPRVLACPVGNPPAPHCPRQAPAPLVRGAPSGSRERRGWVLAVKSEAAAHAPRAGVARVRR